MKKIRDTLFNLMPTFSTAYKDSGVVESNIFAYITPGIMITLAGVVTIIGLSWDQLMINFNTNVALNGLILTILAAAVISSIWFNVRLWQTAKFIREIDATVAEAECSEERYEHFLSVLNRQARVLDTKNMVNLLKNLKTFGHLNVTDNDARLIKSKLGFRVSKSRGKVGFLSGLLVMLGLLGTFWGLLATIDAVGDAMGSMASIGSSDSEGGDGGMSDFIASIAAPLQGMGIAFSSSLFGLAGSLLSGFFNYLCGGAHDRFIETTSRWIDERIPAPGEAMKKEAANPAVANADDLKAWFAGFVQTSQVTQRKIGELVTTMQDNSESALRAAQNTEEILQRQNTMAETLSEVSGSLKQLESQNDHLCAVLSEENANELLAGNRAVVEQLATVTTGIESVATGIESVSSGIEAVNSGMETQSEANQAAIDSLGQDNRQVSEDLKAALESIAGALPDNLAEEYRSLGTVLEHIDENVAELKNNYVQSNTDLQSITEPVAHAIRVIDSRIQVVTGTIEDQLTQLLSETQQRSVPPELSELLSGIVTALNGNHNIQGDVYEQLTHIANQQRELIGSVSSQAANDVQRGSNSASKDSYSSSPSTGMLDLESGNDSDFSGRDEDDDSQTGVA